MNPSRVFSGGWSEGQLDPSLLKGQWSSLLVGLGLMRGV